MESGDPTLRILVSNDDGITARGIRTLAQRLAQEADFSVYVCAPDRERSATGHALTLHKPLRVEEVDMGPQIKGAWLTTGTPSDCVKFAVGCLLKEPPDFVISGINSGANLGGEILYSGTVSAAMEGAFLDIPSIAISCAGSGHTRHYDPAADFVAKFVRIIKKAEFLVGKTLININVPNVPADQIKGTQVTKLGVRAYNDYFEKRVDPRGKTYYWLAGEAIEEGEEENTDAWCISHKMISITPVTFNMTDFGIMEKLNQWSELTSVLGSRAGNAGNVAK